MNLRLSFCLLLSFFVHAFILFSYSLFSKFYLIQPVYVEIIEEDKIQKKSFQIVDQPHFNHQTPDEDYYLSEHNNHTTNEQKGKLGQRSSLPYASSKIDENETSLSFKAPSFLLGNIDHLRGVDTEGFFNRLNTKEILFYTFYSRVKRQIYWHWEKALLNEFEARGFLVQKEFTTRVEASFNSKGYLNSIIIRKKSGLDGLDRASVRAIQKAQPFPHPPEKLISDTGSFKLNYTFVLF